MLKAQQDHQIIDLNPMEAYPGIIVRLSDLSWQIKQPGTSSRIQAWSVRPMDKAMRSDPFVEPVNLFAPSHEP
jgi:hypothetical protein